MDTEIALEEKSPPSMQPGSSPTFQPQSAPAGQSEGRRLSLGGQPLTPQVRQQLLNIEATAEKMYTCEDARERANAAAALRSFSMSASCIPHCQLILDNSQAKFALILASSSLLKLVTTFWNSFHGQQTLDIRNYLLNYLGLHVNTLEPIVVSNLVQLVARVAKLGWNATPQHREICQDLMKFFQLSVRHCILGLQILLELVNQMNQPVPGQSNTQHRKIAVAFRDKSLFYVFQLALTNLQQIFSKRLSAPNETDDSKLKELSLDLALKCLTFDYIGTNPEDTSPDYGTIQVPSTWRPVFEDQNSMKLLFGLLHVLKPDLAAQCMEVIVEFSSVRRSLFSDDNQRSQFIANLCTATNEILRTQQNQRGLLQHRDVYHHFCRLLDRMKSNYTLKELSGMPAYMEWIEQVAVFTIQSFKRWKLASNSIHYLIGLWSRLTMAIPYMPKGNSSGFLENFIPQVTQALMAARLDAVEPSVESGELDELFAEPDLGDWLKHLPSLCRYQYAIAIAYLKSRMTPLAQSYQQCIQSLSSGTAVNPVQVRVIEAQLALLVYYIAAIIGGHPQQYSMTLAPGGRENNDQYDAELCVTFFQLVPLMEFRLQHQGVVPPSKHLDLAVLAFFDEFRRAFFIHDPLRRPQTAVLGDLTDPPAPAAVPVNIYTRMSQVLGPTTQHAIINGMLTKIVHNLQYWVNTAEVLESSLTLLNNLSIGYSSSRLLVESEASKAVLAHHSFENFRFMTVAGNEALRTEFYKTVGRLLFDDANIDLFDQFILPFERVCQFITQQEQSNPRAEAIKKHGIGLCCDLTGVLYGARSAKSYVLFFEWAYPKVLAVVLRLLETWWDSTEVSTAVLQFINQLVDNQSQRITFEPSSSNGVFLFREASKALNTYGFKITSTKPSAEDKEGFEQRIQGISLCLEIMSNCLAGDFVNFGIFQVYNDKAFSSALQTVLQLIFSLPSLDDLLSYKNASETYYTFLEVLFHYHSPLMFEMESKVFLGLFASLLDGVEHFDKDICVKACEAVDHIFSARFNLGKKRDKPSALHRFEQHMEASRDLCSLLFAALWNTFLFENVEQTWQLSRPIFSMLLAKSQLMPAYQQQLIATQAPEVRQRLAAGFNKLLQEGVLPRLDATARDRFTSQAMSFRHEVKLFCVKPVTV